MDTSTSQVILRVFCICAHFISISEQLETDKEGKFV